MQEENKNNQESIKSQEESVDNSGIAKLKKIGLKEVSNKTFINLENLTMLLNKDFSKINKTKAMGFIQILQREFDVDLYELKNEYLAFNQQEKKTVAVAPVEEAMKVDTEPESKKFLPYLLLALAGIFGAYLLFSNAKTTENIRSMDLNVVKNDVVTDEAKESLLALDVDYEQEVNESDEVDLNKVVEEMFRKNQDDNETIEIDEEAEPETNTTVIVDTTASTVIIPAKEEKVGLEEESTLAKLEAITPVVETVKEVKKPKKIENSNRGGLFIQPIQKAWVGIIFLDTMKKKDFLIRRDLQLDSQKDQIILVGHKNFKIFNNQLEQGFSSKKRVRFLYRDGELTEISKKEYQQYAGGVRW